MFKVPYIDLPKQYKAIEKDLISVVKSVFSSGSFILRNDVKLFEENMAKYLGCGYVVGLNSGTDALFLALYAQGFKTGDEVITVSHTFVGTIAVIKHCRLKPVLVDIDQDFNMDAKRLEKAVGEKTRAILPVHLNGRLCNMDKIKDIADRHNLILIEDACQALGATYKQKKSGSFGIGCFSLHPLKNLGGAGDGGFLATDDENLAQKVRLLRNHGQKTKEEIVTFGFNSRLDNLQAAILNIKLKYLPRWIERRRKVAQIYNDGLANLADLKLPPAPLENGDFYDVYNSYCVCTKERDKLVRYLNDSGIEVLVHWPKPCHLQKQLSLNNFHLPQTERISQTILSLPIYPEIKDTQIDYVIETIRRFYRGLRIVK